MSYLLDTNVVIDFFNAKLPLAAQEFLTGIEPAISVITRIELFARSKIPQKEMLMLDVFAKSAKVYDNVTPDIVKATIYIRQKHKIKLPDALIAATAITNNLTLITRNISDFKNIDGLKLIDSHSI